MTALCLSLFVCSALAEEDDLNSLELYSGSKPRIVSADRSPRPASQTAENITVVTAREIEALNAHTLADVLFTVTGVHLLMLRTPGSVSGMMIQGASPFHTLVLIDNVPINNLSDNFPDISSVPAQIIERVEIVKGAASSSWGSALGGVINVITKSPEVERPFGGLVSTSFGKRETVDGRAELTGTLKRFGYYLSGGKLRSDGLLPNNMVDLNSFYGKLHYDFPVRGAVTLTTGFTHGSSGQTIQFADTTNQKTEQLISTLSANYPLTDSLGLEAALRISRLTAEVFGSSSLYGSILSGAKDSDSGASFKASWVDQLQRIVAGVDYDRVKVHEELHVGPMTARDRIRGADRVGVYLNDTFSLGDFAVTPSARFDHTDTGGDLFSPSFGITYALTENSVLRGYTARGYSITSITSSDSAEKVWTSQIGFESTDVPYLWLKGTLFRNETWDIDVHEVEKQRQLKHGCELEARTLPFLDTSLSLGYLYIDARDGKSRAVLEAIPRHALDLGIKYEDSRYLRVLLTGHYIDWNAESNTRLNGKYDDILWDLYLGKKFVYAENKSVELFVSVRNLFNSDQYLIGFYKNAGRWGEMGVRCAF